MNRTIFVIWALMCVSLVFPGGQADDTKSGSEVEVTAPGVFPVLTEPTVLTVFAAVPAWVEDMNTNWTTLAYEEKTNVHIEWNVVATTNKDEKINLLLSAQADLPDVIMPSGLSNEQLVRYGSQGIFIPLNDLIEEQSFYLKNMFSYDPSVLKQITAADGNIYGLPSYNECYHCSYSAKFWMNKVWLDTLGLAVPDTIEELYDVLKAFRDSDANGNGIVDDEIPLAASRGWHGNLDEFLMSSFIYSDGTFLMLDASDSVVSVADRHEFREGLMFLRKLYRENLLDKESFTMDSTQLKALTGNPDGNRLGSIPAGAIGVFLDLTKDRREEYVSIRPLEGPSGIRQSIRYPVGAGTGFFIVTEDCPLPEVAVRWADGFYTDITEWRGEPETDWRPAGADEVGLDGNPARWFNILPYGEPQNKHWAHFQPEFQATHWRDSMAVVQGIWNHEKVLFDATKNNHEPYAPQRIIPPIMYRDDVIDEYGELKIIVEEYIDENIARFITDNLSLENDWDRYVDELNKIGYTRYVEIVNEGYSRQYK